MPSLRPGHVLVGHRGEQGLALQSLWQLLGLCQSLPVSEERQRVAVWALSIEVQDLGSTEPKFSDPRPLRWCNPANISAAQIASCHWKKRFDRISQMISSLLKRRPPSESKHMLSSRHNLSAIVSCVLVVAHDGGRPSSREPGAHTRAARKQAGGAQYAAGVSAQACAAGFLHGMTPTVPDGLFFGSLTVVPRARRADLGKARLVKEGVLDVQRRGLGRVLEGRKASHPLLSTWHSKNF